MCRLPPELIPGICNGMEDKDLLSMALSSRALMNPALDVLWEALYSFTPLLCCLPFGLLYVESTAPRSIHVNSRRKICAQDLKRYLTTYAPRIRSVLLGFRPQNLTISPLILRGLQEATQFAPGALSPNATYLQWLPSMFRFDHAASHITLFAGDRLASIRVRAITLSPLYRNTLLSVVTRISSGIVRLRIDVPSTDPAFIEKLILSHRWDELANLELYGISYGSFRKIALLPRLDKLHLHKLEHFPLRYGINEPPTYPPLAFFPSLKALAIQTNRIPPVIAAVQHLDLANQLESLTVSVYGDGIDPASFEEAEAFFGIVGHHCNPSTFTSLWVSITKSHVGSIEMGNAVNISPLFSLLHLAQIHIASYYPLQLSPPEVTALIASLPELQRLAIIGSKHFTGPPPLDFEHVLQLARGLPELLDLTLRFDATRVEGDERGAGAPYRNIRTLDVLTSPINSSYQVLCYLRVNLPGVRRLEHSFRSGDEAEGCVFRDRWDDIRRVVNWC